MLSAAAVALAAIARPCALNGQAVLDTAAAGCKIDVRSGAEVQPQVIFVDIMMPRLDGYQTCALIKSNQLFKSTPVIMLSSKDGLFDKARGRIVGSEQYLTKPFTRDELLDVVRRYAPAA